jgi:hypothetical protein
MVPLDLRFDRSCLGLGLRLAVGERAAERLLVACLGEAEFLAQAIDLGAVARLLGADG